MLDKKVVRVLLEVTLEKDTPDLTDLIAGRIWSLRGVASCEAVLLPEGSLSKEEILNAD